MAGISDALCNSFKQEVWRGLHASGDEYRAALIRPEPKGDYGKHTLNYAELGVDEVEGEGYQKGGCRLSGRSEGLAGDVAWVSFDDPLWPAPTTLSASGMLIYNASKNGRAVAVWRFKNAPVRSVNGEFRVPLPPPGATSFLSIP